MEPTEAGNTDNAPDTDRPELLQIEQRTDRILEHPEDEEEENNDEENEDVVDEKDTKQTKVERSYHHIAFPYY